jgi:hypothetical protein
MALPSFFIIGAGKAGTTSLNYYLDLHPEIQMSAIKEPNFFAGPANGRPYPMGRVETLQEYERLFDPAVAVRGEASPAYTSFPLREGVPARIKEAVPQAKLIYLVRDPVARTVSHYQHLVATGAERRSLPETLADLGDPFQLATTCYSMYASQLEQYLNCFPMDRILVIDQADLLSERRAVLARAFRFLGVDELFSSPQFARELYQSSERRVYPRRYALFVARTLAPSTQWVPARLRHAVRTRIERTLFRRVERPVLDESTRARLEAIYRDEVRRLRALTGQAFSSWRV